MRNRALVLILCLGGSLLGCSSKPSASDIATGLNEFWGPSCAKISDVTKTNGVEAVNAYRVSFTYKLEVLSDKYKDCSGEQSIALTRISGREVGKGDAYTVTNETNMIKSEKGWIFQ